MSLANRLFGLPCKRMSAELQLKPDLEMNDKTLQEEMHQSSNQESDNHQKETMIEVDVEHKVEEVLHKRWKLTMNETDDPVVQINLLLPEGVMTERAKQLILLSVGQEGKELSFQVEISGRITPTEEEIVGTPKNLGEKVIGDLMPKNKMKAKYNVIVRRHPGRK